MLGISDFLKVRGSQSQGKNTSRETDEEEAEIPRQVADAAKEMLVLKIERNRLEAAKIQKMLQTARDHKKLQRSKAPKGGPKSSRIIFLNLAAPKPIVEYINKEGSNNRAIQELNSEKESPKYMRTTAPESPYYNFLRDPTLTGDTSF